MTGVRRRWYVPPKAAAPAAFDAHDAFADVVRDLDPAGPPRRHRASIAHTLPGEAAMALEVLTSALDAACERDSTRERRDARAWLCGVTDVLYTARVCVEALGGDYDAIRQVLLAQWTRRDATALDDAIAEIRAPRLRRRA